MKRRNLLIALSLLPSLALVSVASAAEVSTVAEAEITEELLTENGLTFFSNGTQLLVNKNGPAILLENGEVIVGRSEILAHLSPNKGLEILNRIIPNRISQVDFNKQIFRRDLGELKDVELVLTYDNYGRVIRTDDELGISTETIYDAQGKRIKIYDSRHGTIDFNEDGRTKTIEGFDGNKRTIDPNEYK